MGILSRVKLGLQGAALLDVRPLVAGGGQSEMGEFLITAQGPEYHYPQTRKIGLCHSKGALVIRPVPATRHTQTSFFPEQPSSSLEV